MSASGAGEEWSAADSVAPAEHGDGVKAAEPSVAKLEEQIQAALAAIEPPGADVKLSHAKLLLKQLAVLNERTRTEVSVSETSLPRSEQDALRQVLDQRTAKYERLRAELRRAAVRVKDWAEKQYAEDRAKLLSGAKVGQSAKGNVLRRRKPDTTKLLQTSKDVTGSLRRTRQAMAKQMDKMSSISTLLEEDQHSLDTTFQEHKQYNSSIRRAGGQLNRLKRRELTDKIVIGIGLVLFACVVAYIVLRRLRYLAW